MKVVLNFTKQKGLYVAEAEITGEFNLHLEKDGTGKVSLYQDTSGRNTGGLIYEAKGVPAVYDQDFSCLVYPKKMRIVSTVPVKYGCLNY